MDLQLGSDAALVTASSGGLGKASAKALAQVGAKVVINGRDEARLEAVREEIAAVADGRVVAQPGDLPIPTTSPGSSRPRSTSSVVSITS